MNERRQEASGSIPSPQLEAWLRELGGIEPPSGLKEKLMATVPAACTRQTKDAAVRCWPRALRYAVAAAAIVAVVSVVVQFLIPPTRPPRLVADINDRSGAAALVDHNSTLPHDINISDNSATP